MHAEIEIAEARRRTTVLHGRITEDGVLEIWAAAAASAEPDAVTLGVIYKYVSGAAMAAWLADHVGTVYRVVEAWSNAYPDDEPEDARLSAAEERAQLHAWEAQDALAKAIRRAQIEAV